MYIALLEVKESYYMLDESTPTLSQEIHLIEANSEEEAEEKLEIFYGSKSTEYSVYFTFNIISINPLLK